MPASLIASLCSLASALSGVPDITNGLHDVIDCSPTTVAGHVVELSPKAQQPYIVPFLSQFDAISSPVWQPRSCGIASLAMILNYHNPHSVSADTLLDEALHHNGYIENVGWIHNTLAELGKDHDIPGTSYDLSGIDDELAFAALRDAVAKGPVIASVHYLFDYTNPIPHLVVITGLQDDTVYHNDPASKTGRGTVPKSQFMSAWKKRFIAFSD